MISALRFNSIFVVLSCQFILFTFSFHFCFSLSHTQSSHSHFNSDFNFAFCTSVSICFCCCSLIKFAHSIYRSLCLTIPRSSVWPCLGMHFLFRYLCITISIMQKQNNILICLQLLDTRIEFWFFILTCQKHKCTHQHYRARNANKMMAFDIGRVI